MKMSLLGLEPESMVREPESSYRRVRVGARGYCCQAQGQSELDIGGRETCVRARVYNKTYGVEPELLPSHI